MLILFSFPILCFAQDDKNKTNAPVKPSTNDCPTWNKKDKKNDKAAYYRSLRSNKIKVKQQTTSNSSSNQDSKIQPNLIPQRSESSNKKINVKQVQEKSNSEKINIVKTKTEKSSDVVSSTDNTANVSSEEKKLFSKQKKSKTVEQKQIVQAQLETQEATKAETAVSNASETDVKKTEKPENDKAENNKIRKKLERMTRKTTKVRKHSNAKCPSF